MRRVITVLAVAVIACGVSYGQEKTEPNENLKCYGPFIGTWRYEGPLLEDVPDMGKKGDKCVVQFSWKRILNKAGVDHNWFGEFEGGAKLSGKAIIGWNAAENQILSRGMNSLGRMGGGPVVFNENGESFTVTGKGVDGAGKETATKGVVTKTGKDVLTWKAEHREGGLVEGPSPVYTFKRVKRARKQKQAK